MINNVAEEQWKLKENEFYDNIINVRNHKVYICSFSQLLISQIRIWNSKLVSQGHDEILVSSIGVVNIN